MLLSMVQYYLMSLVWEKAMFVSTSSLVSDQFKIHSPIDKLMLMKEMKYCKTDVQICYNTFLT